MSTNNRSFNNLTNTPAQNSWCRDALWEEVIRIAGCNPFVEHNGCKLRKCKNNHNDCRGAHFFEDIKAYPHIKKFNRIDKNKYNWCNLYFAIISSLKSNLPMVILVEHKNKIADVLTKNFIEIIQLWREMACYYRKLAKEMPHRNSIYSAATKHPSGYTWFEDVPQFNLDNNIEDTAWAFERLTRFCPIHERMLLNICSHTKFTVWDLCVASGINCKEGVHYLDEHLCISDFLTGTCSCPTKESLNEQEITLLNKSSDLVNQLTKIVESKKSNDFTSIKTSKKKNKQKSDDSEQIIRNEIDTINKQISKISNTQIQIHYCRNGMIPFEQQLTNYHDNNSKKELVERELELEKKEKINHKIIDIATISTNAIKITKLGKKK